MPQLCRSLHSDKEVEGEKEGAGDEKERGKRETSAGKAADGAENTGGNGAETGFGTR